MTIRKQVRQGDVLLNPIDRIPEDAVLSNTKGPIILAEGEATGHAHRIAKSPKVKTFIGNGELFLSVNAPVTLEHEEHSHLVLEPGYYQVRRQVETWLDEIRQVMD